MKIFVNKDIEITEGAKASPLIAGKNELQYYEEGVGIRRIDKDRWREAQHYERKTWCDSQSKTMVTDRNEEHLRNFNNYEILNTVLDDGLSVIELGCGPYTNLRFILPTITKRVDSIHLLDPLINDYLLNSPNCTYKNGLAGHPVITFNTPIEEFESDRKYDLVVMINVLDHCFNIDLIFKKISGMLKDNGVLVINERAYVGAELKRSIENIYDAGHPIRISDEYLNSKLKGYRPLYSNEIIANNIINKYLILQK